MTDRWAAESRTTFGRLVQHARERGDEPAFIVLEGDQVTTLTWDGLLRAAVGYARRYEAEGVRRGDTVLLCLAHRPSMYPAFLGVMLLGAVPGFLAIPSAKQDAQLYWASHEALLQRIRPRLVITYEPNELAISAVARAETAVIVDEGIAAVEGTIDELLAPYEDSDPDAIALLQHSSGTTGLKKGVQLTHNQIAHSVESAAEAIDMTPADRVVSWLPLYHDMGLLSACITPIQMGVTAVSLSAFEWVAQPHILLEAMDTYRGTLAWLPNFAYGHLVRTKTGDETYRLDHVRAFYNGSEPCKPETFDRFLAAFADHGIRRDQLLMGYGLAEAVMTVTKVRPGSLPREVHLDSGGLARGVAIMVPPGPLAQVHLSNGPAIRGVEIRIDAPPTEDGSPIGEIQLRGPFVFSGYHLDDEATSKVFDGEWLRTGDIGCLIDDELYVLGRIKDVIIHHGVNFFAHDIEAAVSAVEGVKKGRCVALAVYDREVGSEAIEVIAERDPDHVRPDIELVAAIRQGVAALFPIVLAKVHVRDPGWMVKTTSGKVSRADNLAKLEPVASHGPGAEETPDAIPDAALRRSARGWDGESRTTFGRLVQQARKRGDDPAFIVLEGDQVTTLSWEDLLRASVGYARRYEAEGVRRGDTVLLCLAHSPSMYPAFLGAMLLGAIPGFLAIPSAKQDPHLYWASHEALLQRIRPSLVITYGPNEDALRTAAPVETAIMVDEGIAAIEGTIDELLAPYEDSDPAAIALLQHSSGTTGLKKGVQLTHNQIADSTESRAEALGMSLADRVVSWLPLYHDMGLLSACIAPVQLGITTVSLDAFDWVARPHRLLEAMDSYQGTLAWLPNFAFGHLVRTKTGDETYQLEHVRAFVNGSEPCKPETFDRFIAAFGEHGVRREQLLMGYGMAEAVMTVTMVRPGSQPREVHLDADGLARDVAIVVPPGPFTRVHLSNGLPIRGIEIRIDAPPAEDGSPIGEIQLRGPFMFSGYHLDDEATARAFDGEWVRTGDLGCLIDDELYVLGRIKDVIIHHGVNYFAHDIEAAVSAVKGVKKGRCVAVAVYDPEVGSEAIEVIAERDPDNLRPDIELVAAIRQGVADLFPIVLSNVHVRNPGWMVKTTSGKVSRADNLAKLDRVTPQAPAAEQTYDDIPSAVFQTIADTFFVDVGTLSRQTVAHDVDGWDSLGHTVLLLRLGRAIGTDIPESVAALATDVGSLIDLIEQHLVVVR